MGAIDNYYEPLVISYDEPLLTNALVEYAHYNEIIFNFPFGFVIKQGADMYEISHDLSLKRVAIEEFDLNTSSYNPSIVTELLRTKGQYKEPVIKDYDVSLSSEYHDEFFGTTAVDPDNFISIGGYYGGRQRWLAEQGYVSQFWADRSCGVAAAANVAYYLSKNKSWAYPLYGNRPDTKAAFTENMYDIYGYLSPAIWGIPNISTMRSRFVDFARSRNVVLTPVIDNSSWTTVNVSNYIRNGLNSDCPVLMITWNTSAIEDLRNHWVTITNYYTSHGTRYITTSNWGYRRNYNLDIWFNTGTAYQGVQYFR